MPSRFLAFLVIASLLQTPLAWGVNHLKPGAFPSAFKDQIHHPSAEQIRRYGSLRAANLASNTGTKNVAVILVQFPASASGLTSGSSTILNLRNIDSHFAQMAAYYSEISYSHIALNFTFFGNSTSTAAVTAGALTLSQPMEYYGCGDEGCGCPSGVPTPTPNRVSANGDYLIRDALVAAHAKDPSLVSSTINAPAPPPTPSYDAVIVVHAGNGNETSSGDNCSALNELGDIWSIFYSQDAIIQSANLGFEEGDVVPETESQGYVPTGVMCHEFGHTLGLPDLYNTVTGASVVGSWELMDAGPYDDFGNNPSHMGAWDKALLGWAAPTVVNSKTADTLPYVEVSPSIIKIPVQNGLPNEYFLVEYRSQASGKLFDQDIPGNGLLIWHVDDDITAARGLASDPSLSNTVNSGLGGHYGVSIVTADGVTLSDANRGDPGNVFGGGPPGFTSPQSNTFSGQPSGINIVNIASVGSPAVSLDILNLTVSTNQSISKVASFPNPAGKGYPHPLGEMHATIQFQVTKPADDYQINIYSLSGTLVRKISTDQITLNATRSANLKWVYEYVWDLKNGDGALVAPGVYLFLVRVDGETRSGKAVVIR